MVVRYIYLFIILPSKQMRNQIQNQAQNTQELVIKYNYPGQINFPGLVQMKSNLSDILTQFKSGDRVQYSPYKKQELEKRLFLLQEQMEVLLKSRLLIVENDGRSIDYRRFLVQKQNQINELQRKIIFYENNFKGHDSKVHTLETQIQRLHLIILQKNKALEHFQQPLKITDNAQSLADSLIGSINELKQKQRMSIDTLVSTVETWIKKLPNETRLGAKLEFGENFMISEERYRNFVLSRLSQISTLYKNQIQEISDFISQNKKQAKIQQKKEAVFILDKMENQISYNQRVLWLLDLSKSSDPFFESIFRTVISGPNYHDFLEGIYSRKVVEVPVQDGRTKALIYKLALEMKRLYQKYPTLSKEIDPKLVQFLSEALLETIEVDEVDRLIEIVKVQPQFIKVENIYNYSCENGRKMQFHLRILIKALLDELVRAKECGFSIGLDEGILGMIRHQILDIIDIDDILKLYRPCPKIVEVEKILERNVETHHHIPRDVNTHIETIRPVAVKQPYFCKNTEIEIVPEIQTKGLIQQRLLVKQNNTEIVKPTLEVHEHYIETLIEHFKEIVVEKIVALKPDTIEKLKTQLQVIQKALWKTQVKQIFIDKYVPVKGDKEEIFVEKKVYEDKPIELVRQFQKLAVQEVEVEKFVTEKQFVQIQKTKVLYRDNHIEVPLKKEKIIPLKQIVPVLEIVDKQIQKVVPCETIIQVPKEVQVPKIIYEPGCVEIREIEKKVQVLAIEKEEKQKIIEKAVEVPIVEEKLKVIKEMHPEILFERIQKVEHVPVEVHIPVPLEKTKIVEVEKIVNVPYETPTIIKCVKETLVPYEKIVQRIVKVPYFVEKIVEKLVQVPKVVEIQKIVERIIPVPRICEKIVEVTREVEKIVPVKQYIYEQVPKIIIEQVPCIQDRVIEIPKPINIIESHQQLVERDKEILKIDKECIYKQIPVDITHEKVIECIKEVGVPILSESIVVLKAVDIHPVKIKEQILVPITIEKPVLQEIDRPVIMKQTKTKLDVVTEYKDKIVVLRQKDVELRIEKEQHQVLRTNTDYKEVQVIRNHIKQVSCPVQVRHDIVIPPTEVIKEVPVYKDLTRDVLRDRQIHTNDIEIIYQPQVLRLKENQPIQLIQQELIQAKQTFHEVSHESKLIEVPRIVQELKVETDKCQKLVPTKEVVQKHTEVTLQKEVPIIECEKKIIKEIEYVIKEELKIEIESCIKTVPEILYEDRIFDVPQIIQKIVEKIYVMPQVVEIEKHIYEICGRGNLEIGCITDEQYTILARNLAVQIKKFKQMFECGCDPDKRFQLEIITRLLQQFDIFVQYPRIKEVIKEVEKKCFVELPIETSENAQRNLTSAVLIDKLLIELRRLKSQFGRQVKWELDEDIIAIFGSYLEAISPQYQNDQDAMLDHYTRKIQSRFDQANGWSQSNLAILQSYINERFSLYQRVQYLEGQVEEFRGKYQLSSRTCQDFSYKLKLIQQNFNEFKIKFQSIIEQGRKTGAMTLRSEEKYRGILKDIDTIIVDNFNPEGTRTCILQPLQEQRYLTVIREKDLTIQNLKDRIYELQDPKRIKFDNEAWQKEYGKLFNEIQSLKRDNECLRKSCSELENRLSKCSDLERQNDYLQKQIAMLEAREKELRETRYKSKFDSSQSNYQSDVSSYRSSYESPASKADDNSNNYMKTTESKFEPTYSGIGASRNTLPSRSTNIQAASDKSDISKSGSNSQSANYQSVSSPTQSRDSSYQSSYGKESSSYVPRNSLSGSRDSAQNTTYQPSQGQTSSYQPQSSRIGQSSYQAQPSYQSQSSSYQTQSPSNQGQSSQGRSYQGQSSYQAQPSYQGQSSSYQGQSSQGIGQSYQRTANQGQTYQGQANQGQSSTQGQTSSSYQPEVKRYYASERK